MLPNWAAFTRSSYLPKVVDSVSNKIVKAAESGNITYLVDVEFAIEDIKGSTFFSIPLIIDLLRNSGYHYKASIFDIALDVI